MNARLGCRWWVRGCQFAFWKHLPLPLGSLGCRVPAWSFEAVTTRLFKQCSARIIRWESIGLLVGHIGLLLNLRFNARDPDLYPEGLKRGGFELSGDDEERSVLAALKLVQSGWGQPGLPGWSSVVDNTGMKGPIDLEELVFPPAPPFAGY